jgi:hypothetical protein
MAERFNPVKRFVATVEVDANGRVCVIGIPERVEREEGEHNCDAAGCSSVEHVLAWGWVAGQPRPKERTDG